MVIKKKRINNIEKYIKREYVKDIRIIGIELTSDNKNKAIEIGFSKDLKIGEVVLPKEIGNITSFNSSGKYIIDKSKKEPRVINWPYHIIDWHGQEHDGIATKIQECYKRRFIKPIQVELQIVSRNSKKYIISKEIVETNLKHIINLFLEIFGECEIINESENIELGKVTRLNWNILPKGKYPWDKLYPYVEEKIKNMKITNQLIARKNIETITKFNPTFVAIGEAGFSGYIIFGFEKSDKVLLESMEIDNATYVLKENWEKISKMTKAEILQNNFHDKRIIHNKKWKNEIEKFIKAMI